MEKTEILNTAAGLISGDRKKTYGDAREDFTRTGNMWAQVLGVPVSPEQVAICMTLLKIGRLCNTPSHLDSWVDAAGYLALGGEIATEDADADPKPTDMDFAAAIARMDAAMRDTFAAGGYLGRYA